MPIGQGLVTRGENIMALKSVSIEGQLEGLFLNQPFIKITATRPEKQSRLFIPFPFLPGQKF